jgi:hypothetical protein
VLPGTPGADAGVRGGDRLAAIDGKLAHEFNLEQIRELFRKDGKVYVLELRRDETIIRAELRTRRLL